MQFLRPGFRSGTVPKLYAKLRRANRKALYTDNWKACSKYLDGLHHVGESVRSFVDRELLELLHESRSWADRSITTGEIHLACNRILIELYCPDLAEDSMWLAFEEQSGWLVASIHRRGWSDALSLQRRHTLASALAGFYKMAGVTLVREQIDARLDPGSRGYRDHRRRTVGLDRATIASSSALPAARLAVDQRTRDRARSHGAAAARPIAPTGSSPPRPSPGAAGS